MLKFSQGIYQPVNKQKYIGKGFPQYRSSWELTLFRVCDTNPAILQWASESIQIPYQDPITLRFRTYIPDLFVSYIDKNGRKNAEIIEVKPYNQSVAEAAKSKRNKAAFLNNMAKWKAATIWCKNQNIRFRVMTEREIYSNGIR